MRAVRGLVVKGGADSNGALPPVPPLVTLKFACVVSGSTRYRFAETDTALGLAGGPPGLTVTSATDIVTGWLRPPRWILRGAGAEERSPRFSGVQMLLVPVGARRRQSEATGGQSHGHICKEARREAGSAQTR